MTRPNTLFDIHRFFKISDGCWLWTGARSIRQRDGSIGYGGFTLQQRSIAAHRAMYQYFYGIDPAQKEVCHTCDNTLCVRPSHLFLGSHSDNMQDMLRKKRGRRALGIAHGLAKLTDAKVRFIRRSRLSQTALAEKFGVTQAAINAVILRQTWRHI